VDIRVETFKGETVMATTLEVIRGISQAAANAYDGALDDKGEPISIGLKREEGNPLIDSRVMDGFGVRFHGNQLCISYQSEVRLKEVYGGSFESDTEAMIEDIAKFLKKEYRSVTGSSLSLKPVGEVEIIVQNTSRVRTWCQAHRFYDIGSIEDVEGIKSPSEDKMDVSFRKFLDAGGFQDGKRPQNDTRKKE
jgi:hypothetical protein